jgi:hypothetical protein
MKRFKARQTYLFLILILGVFFITGCGSGGETGHWLPGPSETIPPTVTFTVPANGATGVAINTKITATFSEAMDPATIITPTTFTVKQGATAVAGTVTYTGVTAVFTPATSLLNSSTYTATITTGATDLAGNQLAGNQAPWPAASNYVWSFTTGAAPDTTKPTVTFTVPANGATGVITNTKISATFSEAMDPLTITTATFTLQQGATAIPGTVIYSGVTAVFTPATSLLNSSTYTATITTGATDLAGNQLAGNQAPWPAASNYVWSFTTGAAPDTTRPRVILTVPADLATGVLTNTKISATFSEAMDPLTITTTTFTVKQGATSITGIVTYSGITAVFVPATTLAASTTYTAKITSGATDLAGNQLAGNQAPLPAASDYVWSFTTGAVPDTTRPRVILTVPANGATNVALNSQVTATFSKAMDPLTITTTTFTLTAPGLVWSATVYYSGVTAILTPYFDLAPSTTYTATITTGAKDLAGNQLAGNQAPLPAASNYVWTFSTGAAPAPIPPPPPIPPPLLPSCLGPGPVDMGDAASFGVLVGPAGGATLTNNGLLTTVNGDVGAASQVTAPTITAGYFNYTGVDAPYVAAKAAMLTAIACATARPCGAGVAFNFGADHDFGGDTLAPGVYCVTGGMSVGSNLTLSTPGVYIFRSTGAMTSANTITMAFGGTANPTNTSVFWVPTGAASIGTNNAFLGTIMPAASAATTLGANTTLLGRAMSNSDVTLNTNTITRPIP